VTTYVAATGDLHAGSTIAPCPSDPIPLDDGGVYHRSKAQAWVTGHYESYWHDVKKLRKKKGDKLVIVLNGDLVDGGAHHGTHQCISGDLAVQSLVLQLLAKPLIDCDPDAVVIVRGTGSHVGKSGGAEEAFGKWLIAQGLPVIKGLNTATHYHFTGSFGGVRFDLAHHGAVGARPWTRQNAVNAKAVEIFYEYAHRDEQPPQIAVRSHCHLYADSGPATKVRVLALPAWQLKTEYGHAKFPDSLADVGGAIIRCEDGKFEVETKLYYPKRDTLWRSVL